MRHLLVSMLGLLPACTPAPLLHEGRSTPGGSPAASFASAFAATAAVSATVPAAPPAAASPRRSCPTDSAALELRFLDVGQGDAALATSPDGRRVLVDAGRPEQLVASYLRRHRITRLDLVVASHNHADHIGGLPAVIRAVEVRNYMENGLPATTATYRRVVGALEQRGVRVLAASSRTLTLGDVQVRVLAPPATETTQNNRSVGLVLQFGEFRALLTGDAEHPALRAWLREGVVPRVSVVKVGHHGSWNASSAEWVRATDPDVAVISVGRNSYGHPSSATLALWSAPDRRIFRTDLHGTIVIRGCRDGALSVSTSRGGRAARTHSSVETPNDG